MVSDSGIKGKGPYTMQHRRQGRVAIYWERTRLAEAARKPVFISVIIKV